MVLCPECTAAITMSLNQDVYGYVKMTMLENILLLVALDLDPILTTRIHRMYR